MPKKFIPALLGLLLSLGGWLTDAAAAPADTMQLITGDITASRTIIWQTDAAGQDNHVEYKLKHSRRIYSQTAETVVIPNFDEAAPKYQHSVYIENLAPQEDYMYRTVSDNRASAWYSLHTPATDSFQAIIFGDSQSVNYGVWGETAAAAWQRNKAADLFIVLGDLVDNGQHAWQWSEWFKYAAPLGRSIPLAPVSGNHENYSLNWQFAPADIYKALFKLPANGPAGLQNQAYSFDCGSVHFVVLDTQLEELSAVQPDLFSRQQAWLKQDLSQTDKLWKIILMHRTPLSYDGLDTMTTVGQAFMPIFEKYNVDIVFTGHIHAYGRTKPLKNGQPNISGTIYISAGRSGDDAWPIPQQKKAELAFNPQLSQTNYLTLTQTDRQLTVRDYQLDGTLFDELILQK